MVKTLHPDGLEALVYGDNGDPFAILGAHQLDTGVWEIRAFRPTAKSLDVVNRQTGKRVKLKQMHEAGFFSGEVSGDGWNRAGYHFIATTHDGHEETFHDAYAFHESYLTDYELYLHAEGNYLNAYEKMGAHLREIDGVTGVNFAVWAPNAYKVAVVGDFNGWDARCHPMRRHVDQGIWELFIPGVGLGAKYKFELRSHNMGYRAEKADPYGFYAELRPATASIVVDIDAYTWGDDAWMEERREMDFINQPMAVYEAHLGSWKRKAGDEWLTYRELADELVPYLVEMNYTHIELMPVAEHPFDGSWGYQVTGYYAPTSRFGTPQDFMYFVDQCHQHNIGVIVDWVPAHFPKDGFALSYFDGTHLYSHEDSRKGEHPDWGTYIFNYGRNEVKNFLLANALFWLRYYHIDGLRVDAVSSMLYLDFGRESGEWIPNMYGGNENLEAVAFLRQFNEVVHENYPGAVTIAEESTSWAMVSRPTYLGGLGFTFKWNMGWMHDTLKYLQKDSIYRRYHHNQITFSMMYAFSENFVLSLSHDEVVHGKGSIMGKVTGDDWQKFATVRALYGYQATHPGKYLNFMGSEIAQWREWSEARSLDWHLLDYEPHQKMQRYVRELNAFYQSQPPLYEQDFVPEGFQWLDANDADNSIFTYMRFAKDQSDFLVVAVNFTPVPRQNYRIGVPVWSRYAEVLNSDSDFYGGGNVGNGGEVHVEDVRWNGQPHSLNITVPPLAIVIFKPLQS
ncbi:1,4-alpha-glucan branching protein GlgB [bacterium]|nr:1,4-alpha-glucan branching protein GlgB [bacterium]